MDETKYGKVVSARMDDRLQTDFATVATYMEEHSLTRVNDSDIIRYAIETTAARIRQEWMDQETFSQLVDYTQNTHDYLGCTEDEMLETYGGWSYTEILRALNYQFGDANNEALARAVHEKGAGDGV